MKWEDICEKLGISVSFTTIPDDAYVLDCETIEDYEWEEYERLLDEDYDY